MRKNIFGPGRLFLFLCALFVSLGSSAAGSVGGTSVVKISSSYNGMGMIIEPITNADKDVMNLQGGDSFVLTAGSFTTSGWSFDGKLVAALVRGSEVVDVMAERAIKLSTDAINMVYMVCQVSEGVEVRQGDMIRLLTTVDDENYTLVNAAGGSGLTDRIPATGYSYPFQKITMPMQVDGAVVEVSDECTWTDRVMWGRNFYFYVTPDVEGANVVVRVNGSVIKPSTTGMYSLSRVTEPVDISIRVYNQIAVEKKVIDCTEDLRVADLLTEEDLDCLKGLKVNGPLKAADFEIFCMQMSALETLDLAGATLENNYIPESAFAYNQTISKLRLPESTRGASNNSFYFMAKLEFIVLPPSLNNFGFNQFFGSGALKTVWAQWSPLAEGVTPFLGFHIPPCAFRATLYASEGTLIVPKGCLSAYKATDTWANFKTIREEVPVDKVRYITVFDRYFNDVTGVTTASAGQTVDVFVEEGGCRVVAGSEEAKVAVFTPDAKMLKQFTIRGGEQFVALVPGCYIVRVGDESHKILITR